MCVLTEEMQGQGASSYHSGDPNSTKSPFISFPESLLMMEKRFGAECCVSIVQPIHRGRSPSTCSWNTRGERTCRLSLSKTTRWSMRKLIAWPGLLWPVMVQIQPELPLKDSRDCFSIQIEVTLVFIFFYLSFVTTPARAECISRVVYQCYKWI